MIELKNAMEIFKVLPKTNCRDCLVPTCFAFAAAVFKGEKRLKDCPHIDKTSLDIFTVMNSDSRTLEREEHHLLSQLREGVCKVDLASSGERLDAFFSDDSVFIKSLGKFFRVDSSATITSDCHVHGWVSVPLLDYVASCKGIPLSGKWVPLRELKNGGSWAPLFEQRCEKPLKRLADSYTDLFEMIIQIFNAKPATNTFNSDIAVVLYPLPRVPLLICYWKPDGELQSSLHMFFDDVADSNLTIDSLYRLTAGLVIMFEKIALTHGK